MRDFLNEIGITLEGTETDDQEYIIDIDDSNLYSKVFSTLENSKKVSLAENDSDADFASDKFSHFFESDSYEIELEADFDSDKYKLICRKIED